MKCMKSLKKKTINPQVAASNGYTVEVFKFFWVVLKEFILKSINSIFSKIKKNSYFSTFGNFMFAMREINIDNFLKTGDLVECYTHE